MSTTFIGVKLEDRRDIAPGHTAVKTSDCFLMEWGPEGPETTDRLDDVIRLSAVEALHYLQLHGNEFYFLNAAILEFQEQQMSQKNAH